MLRYGKKVMKQSARTRFRKLPFHVFVSQTTGHVGPSAYDPRRLNERFQLISFERMDNFSERMTKSFERMQIFLNGCTSRSNGWGIVCERMTQPFERIDHDFLFEQIAQAVRTDANFF